jgi:hypothetical protein
VVTRLPPRPLGLVAALAVIFVAMFLLPADRGVQHCGHGVVGGVGAVGGVGVAPDS